MNKLELRREITVECYEVLGTVGLPQKREHILYILKIAEQRSIVTPADVSRELLGDGRLSVANRLLGQCERLQLLKEDSGGKFRITDIGIKTLDQGRVYVEVDSVWRIWTVKDELISQKVLLVEEVDSRQSGKSDGHSQTENSTESIPQLLKDVRHQILNIPFGEIKSCTVDFKDKCSPRKDLTRKVQLYVEIDDTRAVLILEMDQKKVQIGGLNKQRLQVIDELMQKSSHLAKWDRQYQLLKTVFSSLSESEVSGMEKTICISDPELDGLGQFEAVDFPVNIYPESQADTDRWADWFLSRSISTFVVDGEYEAWKKDAASRFSLGEPQFKTLIDKRGDFVSANDGRKSKEYWYLTAAADWNLEGVSHVTE